MRPVCQPDSVVGRRNGEHWAGRLWGRKISLPITRLLAPTKVTPDGITSAMIMIGLLASVSLAIPGLVGAVGAAIAIQVYLVADCIDGELARWRGKTSMRGAYLDRLGHYVVEASLFCMYGFHVERTWSSPWTAASLGIGVLVVITKAETDLVLAVGGTGSDVSAPEALEPRATSLRSLRRIVHPLRIHRLTGAAEATLLMVVAAAIGLGWDDAERAAIVVFAVVAVGLAVGHAVAIVNSERVR